MSNSNTNIDIEDVDFGGELMQWARFALDAFRQIGNHPQLVGAALISSGVALQTFAPALDFVIWDFSGGVVPSTSKQLTGTVDPTKPTDPTTNPSWLQIWENSVLGSEKLFFGALLGQSQTVMQGVQQNPLTAQTAQEVGAALPNLLGLLGLKLPTQIRLSQMLILGGLLGLFEPLLQTAATAIGGALSSIIKL